MRDIILALDRFGDQALLLGRVGENRATRVLIDLKSILSQYPDAIASITVKQPSRAEYPAAVKQEDGILTWEITSADIGNNAGSGQAQITLRDADGTIIKTAIAYTRVGESLGDATAPAPDPVTTWIDKATGTLADVERAGNAAQAVADEVQRRLDDGDFVGPQGPKGDRGETGPIGPQGPKGEKGDKGETGEKGDTGPQGETGAKGDAFTFGDFTPEQLESLRGPKGDTGATGPQGTEGAVGPQGPQGAKGEPGKDAVIDATLTQEGAAADAKATGEAISQLKEDLCEIITVSQSQNLLNPDNIIHGHFYKIENKNGTRYIELAEKANFDCALVEVIDGVTDYIANGISYNSYSATKDMEYLGIVSKASQSVNNPVFDTTIKSGETPNKPVKYLTMSWSNKAFDTSHMIIVAGKTLPDEYISYFKQQKLNDEIIIDYSQIENIPKLDKEIKLYVGFGDVDNKTKFDKVVDAFKETEKQEGKYTVYIAEGTYDMFTEYGGIEKLQNYDPSKDTPYNTQPWLYNTTVIGNGRVKLVYAPDTTEYSEARFLYSPLNIRGNTKIENIEIYCDGGRYCIHDETGSISTYYDTEHIYKNVVCETGANTGRCIGGGCDYGQRYTLENCTFKTGYTKAWSSAGIVSWHNRKTTRGCTFLFNNCKFLCTETSREHSDLRFSNVGSGNALSNVSLNNCYFSFGQIRLAIESESNPSDNKYQIICSNSNKQNLLVDEKLGENLYPLIEYNPIQIN